MTLVTFVIPVAPHHADLSQRAIMSALRQTIRSEVVTAVDEESIGAGAMRNLLTQRVDTPFVVFLDADDEVNPYFVQRAIQYYRRGKYVYTDWLDDEGRQHESPNCSRGGIFLEGQYHTITTLLPTALFRMVGGFDETLAGMEDVDLYLKLQAAGVCGERCPAPLMVYHRRNGKRARGIRETGQYDGIVSLLQQRYQGKMRMCNCGEGTQVTQPPANEQQPGDILVEALYAPASMVGPVSRRTYPRTGNRRRLWIDPRDMLARPDWWQSIPETSAAAVAPDVDTVLALADAALADAEPADAAPAPQPVDDEPWLGEPASDELGDEEAEPAQEEVEEEFDVFDLAALDEEPQKPKNKPKK